MSDTERDVEEALGRREESRRLWLAQKSLRWAADKISGDTPRGDRAEEDLRRSAEMLEPMIEDGWRAISDTAPGRIAVADDLQTLRDRLEEAEKKRESARQDEAFLHGRLNKTRRRLDALTEAVREALEKFKQIRDRTASYKGEKGHVCDYSKQAESAHDTAEVQIDRLREHLPDGEDEGEREVVDTPLPPDCICEGVERTDYASLRVFGIDPDCPVHGEDEGDAYGGDEACPTMGCSRGWGHEGPCDKGPVPTDEPEGDEDRASVTDDQMAFFIRDYYQPAREKTRELAAGKGEGSSHQHRLAVEKALEQWREHAPTPTHADARSEVAMRAFRRVVDSTDGRPGSTVVSFSEEEVAAMEQFVEDYDG